MKTYRDFHQVPAKSQNNLWYCDGQYYQLVADGVTQDKCWLINAKMIGLKPNVRSVRIVCPACFRFASSNF